MSHHHVEISLQDNDPLRCGIGMDASAAITLIFLFKIWLWLSRTPPCTTFRPRIAVIRRVMRIRTKIMEAWVYALTYWSFITSVGAPLPSAPPPEPTRQSLRSGNRVKGYKRHKWHLAHMHWVCIVLITLVHIQTTDYYYTAQGPRAAATHIPQWLKYMVYIPVDMLWDIGAQLRKLSNDIHPLPGPSPPPSRSIRFVTLNVGGPFLSKRRWGRLLQEVTANESAIVGLQEFRFRT